MNPDEPRISAVLDANLIVSGAIVRHGMLEANASYLQKPFTPDALVRKLREVLNG